MASTLRPIGHEERLSVVDHLDELRRRLIVCVITLGVVLGVCMWQNHELLHIVGKPLDDVTHTRTKEGKGPLGEIYKGQQGARAALQASIATDTALARPDSGLSPSARTALSVQVRQARVALAKIPAGTPPNRPITLGVSEPFTSTLIVSFYFALLIAGPLILWQLYGFVLPAFTPEERRVAVPVMAMIPAFFIIGAVFGYLVVLPAATNFLQNFNSDQFNVLVQANQYYKFAALLLLAMGMVFQLPVGILALCRLGIVSVRSLRKNRRYAILILVIIGAALPGVDPVSMIIETIPLLLLYEFSIVLARIFGGPERENTWLDRWNLDDDEDGDPTPDDDEELEDALP